MPWIPASAGMTVSFHFREVDARTSHFSTVFMYFLECDEVRIVAGRRADNPEAIRALGIPAEIRKLCE